MSQLHAAPQSSVEKMNHANTHEDYVVLGNVSGGGGSFNGLLLGLYIIGIAGGFGDWYFSGHKHFIGKHKGSSHGHHEGMLASVGTVPGHSDNEVWVPADRDTVGEVGWYTDDYYLDSPVPFWYGPNGEEVGKEETNADQWIH